MYALLGYHAIICSQNITAAVIGRDPNPFMSYFLIDQGSDNGLRRGMPVITDQGLVGRIDAVTATGARVQLITDASSVVNVQMDPDRGDGADSRLAYRRFQHQYGFSGRKSPVRRPGFNVWSGRELPVRFVDRSGSLGAQPGERAVSISYSSTGGGFHHASGCTGDY